MELTDRLIHNLQMMGDEEMMAVTSDLIDQYAIQILKDLGLAKGRTFGNDTTSSWYKTEAGHALLDERKRVEKEIAVAVNAFLRNSKLSIMDSSFGGSVMAWHVYHDDAEGEYESTAATPLEAILDWYENEQDRNETTNPPTPTTHQED
jgi:hypothetical protein